MISSIIALAFKPVLGVKLQRRSWRLDKTGLWRTLTKAFNRSELFMLLLPVCNMLYLLRPVLLLQLLLCFNQHSIRILRECGTSALNPCFLLPHVYSRFVECP